MTRPLTKHRKAYKEAVAKQLGQLYSPIYPAGTPNVPNPTDTTGRLEHIKRMLELGEISRSIELIENLIDAFKE